MSNTSTPRRGRPPGTFSFVSVRMQDLANVVGPNGNVTVSAKFAEQLGIPAAVGVKASVIHKKSAVSEGTVAVSTVTAPNP